jgi:hypothetical protein
MSKILNDGDLDEEFEKIDPASLSAATDDEKASVS